MANWVKHKLIQHGLLALDENQVRSSTNICTVAFLVLAFGSLGRLRGMGMIFADWEPASARFWFWAAALGVAAGIVGLVLAHLAHSRINVADNWRVFLLQVALWPVLEEFLFRGYLMRLTPYESADGDGNKTLQCGGAAWGRVQLFRGEQWAESTLNAVSGSGELSGRA